MPTIIHDSGTSRTAPQQYLVLLIDDDSGAMEWLATCEECEIEYHARCHPEMTLYAMPVSHIRQRVPQPEGVVVLEAAV